MDVRAGRRNTRSISTLYGANPNSNGACRTELAVNPGEAAHASNKVLDLRLPAKGCISPSRRSDLFFRNT